ncbi:hypothetical protein RHGRI_010136 [Rhododendron griersonianum]|uniref:Uncharacterized protein n=1 Tax=Rhododendron griersonianum TaxID=479676 RepID=A0AAV6KHL5_9ERIC|nr:hypothetical protein RHGRI_010136 [Rhododendron griersonianum]
MFEVWINSIGRAMVQHSRSVTQLEVVNYDSKPRSGLCYVSNDDDNLLQPLNHKTDEQEEDVGIPIRRRLHHPPVLHLEHHQIDPLLVLERRAVVLLRVAGAVRGGGAGGGVRASLDGRRAGRGGPGHPGDVDNRAGPAGLLREAAAGAGGGGEGADGGDHRVRAQDLDQGREFRGSCLRGGGVLRAY